MGRRASRISSRVASAQVVSSPCRAHISGRPLNRTPTTRERPGGFQRTPRLGSCVGSHLGGSIGLGVGDAGGVQRAGRERYRRCWRCSSGQGRLVVGPDISGTKAGQWRAPQKSARARGSPSHHRSFTWTPACHRLPGTCPKEHLSATHRLFSQNPLFLDFRRRLMLNMQLPEPTGRCSERRRSYLLHLANTTTSQQSWHA